MKLDEVVAVSGMPGLYKIVTTRDNGLIVEDIDTQKSKFVSVRKHQFTPLATVAIYTEMDTAEISDVFAKMLEQKEDNPPPPVKSPSDVLFGYFATILPEYDRDQVMVSDVKKVIKWFNFLTERGLFPFEKDGNDEEE